MPGAKRGRAIATLLWGRAQSWRHPFISGLQSKRLHLAVALSLLMENKAPLSEE